MNDRLGVASDSLPGMHDIGRNHLIMGGSSGQTSIVTATSAGTPLNGVAQNGVHHPTSEPPTTTTTNNNNLVIKCNSNSVSAAHRDFQSSHVPGVTMSDGPGQSEASHDHHRVKQPEIVTVTVSSASEASSVASSRSSSLSVSPNPMMLIRGAEEEVEEIGDARKVEPLKINLHREPIRTVIKLGSGQSADAVSNNHTPSSPKITIKPIPNPAVVSSSSGNDLAKEEEGIPKLHIRMNNDHQETDPQVPKLTIKMAQNSVPQLQSPSVPKLTIKTNASGGVEVGENHPVVPKLTIKVANDQSSISSSSLGMSPGSTVTSSCGSSTNHVAAATAGEEGVLPKLKVKLPRAAVPSEEDDEEESEPSHSEDSVDHHEVHRSPRVPKLTIKPIVASPPKTYGTNQSNDAGPQNDTVPKLIIKSKAPAAKEELADGETQLNNNHRHPAADALSLDMPVGGASGGPQSPRIILKIHKNQNSIVSSQVGDGDEVAASTEEGHQPLKRTCPTEQQPHVNNTPKRAKGGEERIIAMIDLDEETSSRSGVEDAPEEEEQRTVNGRPLRRRLLAAAKAEPEPSAECDTNSAEAESNSSSSTRASRSKAKPPPAQPTPAKAAVEKIEEEPTEDRLQTPSEIADEDLQTPVVKRGRGRPRKTPLVSRDDSDNLEVMDSSKKKPRKKRSDAGVPRGTAAASALAEAASDEEGLPSPAAFGSVTKRPRGGGRGGSRTPASSRGGSAAKRGRGGSSGSMRKPFNKQLYFKQKNKEDSIMNTYFEEDTRMSAADSLSTPKVASSSLVNQHDPQDSVSQSSHLSSNSVTMDSTQTSSLPARKKLKMEVVGTIEGKTEFTVDMLAEYVWPPGVGACPNKERDTFMIQEQVAEFLGVKSFKRKYPDLDRRIVEMEERDYLFEQGLVTEKMCDLGVTAVYAVDVLDIMHQDFHEKYEQYKLYHREKMARDLTMRQKLMKAEMGIGARDKAMRSVSNWNSNLNKTRLEDRRVHMDLQNFTIQVPASKRKNMTYPTEKPSLYPLAVVVGQFAEHYKTYSPLELQCYPLNTACTSPEDLMKRLLEEKMRKQQRDRTGPGAQDPKETVVVAEESVDSSSDNSTSDDESEDSDEDDNGTLDTSSSESDCDVHDDDVCCVCSQSQFTSPNNIPELFVKCAICSKMAHPSCIEMSSEMAKRAFQYQWQCVDCKRCQSCQKSGDQQKMIYCHQCDRAYHVYCTQSLTAIPKGMWHCDICSICRKCGCRNPDGTNNRVPAVQQQPQTPLGSPSSGAQKRPEWRHEYVKNEATGLKEHCGMLCVRCTAEARS